MQRITIDGRRMDSRADAHRYLQQQLGLPETYGRNLDALNDCLSEISGHITITYAAAIRNTLGAYGQILLRVFTDAAKCRGDLVVRVLDGGD